MEKEKNPTNHICSFCYKRQEEVDTLVLGQEGVFICDQCIRSSFERLQVEKKSYKNPALQPYQNRWFVLKIGGELVLPENLEGIATALTSFLRHMIKPIIVHGGGPQASKLTEAIGLTPKKIAGRRVTDANVLSIMKQALGGEVSINLASILQSKGVPVLAVQGVSANLIEAKKRPPQLITGGPEKPVDLGFVGDVVSINTSLLEELSFTGHIPVLSSLGGDKQGGVWNINADIVASKLAVALGAAKLFFISGVPGVLQDKDDPKTRIEHMDRQSAKEAIAKGWIQGGMIPKVEEALGALEKGVEAVHICGFQGNSFLEETCTPGSHGTVIQKKS